MIKNKYLSNNELNFYKRYGYLVKHSLISQKNIKKINNKIKILKSNIKYKKHFEFLNINNRKYCVRLRDPHSVDKVFFDVAKNNKILAILKDLLGGSVRFHHSKLNFKPPSSNAGIIAWHQDWAFYPHTNDDLIAIGIYLEDCLEKNGPLKVIPGSHKLKIFNHHKNNNFVGKVDIIKEKINTKKSVNLVAKAGSVTFHHVRTLHSSALNLTNNFRPLLLFGYCAVDAWPITFDAGSSIDPNINLKAYDKLILKGKPTLIPRLKNVPVRMPLPRSSDSIYQLQNIKKK
tara:strand:+ start:113 stop:976 length:864 start_codon:yes stop_codon:yes gene_type:complete